MCGIFGYLGGRKATPILVEGIKNLEYRGYDSAGMAVVSSKGRVISEKAEKLVLAREKVKEYLNGVKPKKIIFVPGRLISIVI